MTQPVRLQLSRRAGFDLQAHSRAVNGLPAVNVARPSKWGNPFVVGKDGTRQDYVGFYAAMVNGYAALTRTPRVEQLIEAGAYVRKNYPELKGKNLACWCALDGKPCHADVLLDLANRPICEETHDAG